MNDKMLGLIEIKVHQVMDDISRVIRKLREYKIPYIFTFSKAWNETINIEIKTSSYNNVKLEFVYVIPSEILKCVGSAFVVGSIPLIAFDDNFDKSESWGDKLINAYCEIMVKSKGLEPIDNTIAYTDYSHTHDETIMEFTNAGCPVFSQYIITFASFKDFKYDDSIYSLKFFDHAEDENCKFKPVRVSHTDIVYDGHVRWDLVK